MKTPIFFKLPEPVPHIVDKTIAFPMIVCGVNSKGYYIVDIYDSESSIQKSGMELVDIKNNEYRIYDKNGFVIHVRTCGNSFHFYYPSLKRCEVDDLQNLLWDFLNVINYQESSKRLDVLIQRVQGILKFKRYTKYNVRLNRLLQLVMSKRIELEHVKYEKLDALSSHSDNESDACHDKQMTISVWKEKLPTGEIQIVVQGKRHYFFCASSCYAEGFLCSKTGEIKPLPDDTLWRDNSLIRSSIHGAAVKEK